MILTAAGARADENVVSLPHPDGVEGATTRPGAGWSSPARSSPLPPIPLADARDTGVLAHIQTYDAPCSYCAKAQGLTLIPILGPWLGARAAGRPTPGLPYGSPATARLIFRHHVPGNAAIHCRADLLVAERKSDTPPDGETA